MTENLESSATPRIRVRIESLSDLVLGLALSFGSLILIGSQPRNGMDLLVNIFIFGFSFMIVIWTWIGYTRTIAVLPTEAPFALPLNLGLLFCVALEPYLFYVLITTRIAELVDPASIAFPYSVLVVVFVILGALGGALLLKRFFPNVEKAKLSKKGDFEKTATLFGLMFGVGGALFTLGSFYDRTVTRSSCYDTKTVNVTSTNCKIMETVTIPQLGGYGNFGSLVLLITVVSLAVFAIWLAVLYSMSKI